MFSKKQIIILLVLLAVLVGVIFVYRASYDRWPWQGGAEVVTPAATASPEASTLDTPGVKTEREIIMEDAAQAIADISPVEPVLGGSWYVLRFWFVNGSNLDFYAEYEDGHILRRVLLQAQEKEMGLNYEVVAYFEPGEAQWALKSGQDTQFGKNLDLFEFNDTLGRWTKRN